MVKIIKIEPHPTVVKQKVCKNCGATLEYVPNDVQNRKTFDYDGSSDIYHFIVCPNCKEELTVRSY